MAEKPGTQTWALNLLGAAYVECDNNLTLNFQGANPYSIEGWVYFDGLNANAPIVSKQGEFEFGNDGACLYVTRTNMPTRLETQEILDIGRWHHVAVTYSASGTLTLYLDGVEMAQMITHDPGTPGTGNPFQLGTGLQGRIHRMRFWNIWLSDSQIYRNQFEEPGAQTGLLADYALNNNPVTDESGNGHTISYHSGAKSQSTTPAMQLLGTGFAEPVDPGINPGSDADPYTIQTWIRLDTIKGRQAIFANGNYHDSSGILLSVDNGIVKSQRGGPDDTVLSGSTTLQAGVWYNIATAYDGTNLSLFVDGVADADPIAAGALTALPEGSPIIGATKDSQEPTPNLYLQGEIQTVLVWNMALDAAAISNWMYNDPIAEENLVAYYNFTMDPARNLMNTNSLGLVDGAVIRPSIEEVESITRSLNQAAPEIEALKRKSFTHFSPEHIEHLAAEFDHLTKRHPAQAQIAKYRAKYLKDLQDSFGQIQANPEQVPLGVVFPKKEGGHWVFYEQLESGPTEVQRYHELEIDDCTVWLISYVMTCFSAFLAVFDLPSITSVGISFLRKILDANPALKAFFTTTVEGGLIGVTAILAILKGLYTYGYLIPLFKMAAKALGWWALTKLIAKIIIFFVPGQGELELAVYIANAAVAIAKVAYSFSQKPDHCYTYIAEI